MIHDGQCCSWDEDGNPDVCSGPPKEEPDCGTCSTRPANQARVYDDTAYYDRTGAALVRDDARARLLASGNGRRERYAVAELTLADEED